MKVLFSAYFKKRVKKLPIALRRKLKGRLSLLMEDPYNSLLNNQTLAGKRANYRTINIDANYRAVFQLMPDDTAYLIDAAKRP